MGIDRLRLLNSVDRFHVGIIPGSKMVGRSFVRGKNIGVRKVESESGAWRSGADLIGLIGTAANRSGREATSGGPEGRIGRLLRPIRPARPGSTDACGLAGLVRMGLDGMEQTWGPVVDQLSKD